MWNSGPTPSAWARTPKDCSTRSHATEDAIGKRPGKSSRIGNILDKPTYGNCDPRYPIQIVELDPKSLSLKRDTVTIIKDRERDDPEQVRFSNFRVYEERGTGDFVLLMTKCYSESTPGFPNLPYPSYRYRLSAPG